MKSGMDEKGTAKKRDRQHGGQLMGGTDGGMGG